MYYSGIDNKVYQEYAKYRDWLYGIDDRVKETIYTSLFTLVDMPTLRNWYVENVSSYEAAMHVIIKGVL